MGRTRALLLGFAVVCATIACNQIVGVTDVKYKNTASGQTGDDDDGSTNTDPNPVKPTKPAGDSGPGTVDSGPTIAAPCNGAPDCERIVFVTQATFDGNLGGTAGADAKCTAAGAAIPAFAGRQFKAWLSDVSLDVNMRVVAGTKPYRRVDRSIFANSHADMIKGTVNLPLYFDETGAALTGTALERSVWTATDPAGVWDMYDCAAWTSNAATDTGAYGDSQMSDANWTQVPGPATNTCDSKKHLYCLEN